MFMNDPAVDTATAQNGGENKTATISKHARGAVGKNQLTQSDWQNL